MKKNPPTKSNNYSIVFPMKNNYVSRDFGNNIVIEKDPYDDTNKVMLIQNGFSFVDKSPKTTRAQHLTSRSENDITLDSTTSRYNSTCIRTSYQLKEINSSQFYKTPTKAKNIDATRQMKDNLKMPIVYECINKSERRGKKPFTQEKPKQFVINFAQPQKKLIEKYISFEKPRK